MDIYIKPSSQEVFTMKVELTETIKQIKEKLAIQTENPVAQQKLISNGRLLEDEKTLQDYNIKSKQTLY